MVTMLRAKKQHRATSSAPHNGYDLSAHLALERLPQLPPALRELDISGCIRLRNIASLAEAGSLVVLCMRACACVQNLDPISGLHHLKVLDVRGCASLAGPAPLLEMPRLETVRWAGASGDWSRYPQDDGLCDALSFFSLEGRRRVVHDAVRHLSPLMVPNGECFLWYVEGMVNLLADFTLPAARVDTLSAAKQTLCFIAAATFYCTKCACIYPPSVAAIATWFGFSEPNLVIVEEGHMINRTSLDVLSVTAYATHLEWAAFVWGLVDETEERAAREGRPFLDRLLRIDGRRDAPLVLALASLPGTLLDSPVVQTLFDKVELDKAREVHALAATDLSSLYHPRLS
jgi:hypothetical protein